MPWWSALIAPVAALFTKALDVVDKFIPDKDLATKLKAELAVQINNIAHTEFLALIESQTSIIIAETKGESWLQRNWRPLLMASFGAIVVNNYMLAPYLGALLGPEYKIMMDIPPDMWGLLKLGVSGYVVGRTLEKVADGDGLRSVAGKVMNGKGGSNA